MIAIARVMGAKIITIKSIINIVIAIVIIAHITVPIILEDWV